MIRTDEPLWITGAGRSPALTPDIAGSKAALLWQMDRLGLDVPPAFVLPTTWCAGINAGDGAALEALHRGLTKGIAGLERATGRRFGDGRAPLLVSVRSGAAVSMPGMLDTILNIGLNDESVHGLIRLSGNPRLAFDSYRRLVQGYGEVVDGVTGAEFERRLTELLRREGVTGETELDPEALERLTGEFREVSVHVVGHSVPEDPREQLQAAATAIYASWQSPRACDYRRLGGIDDRLGTAVTVQAMVFGNSGGNSGAGVAFSRNPATGANEFYVDFLFDAQGEDVVSGRRSPGPASRLAARLPQVASRLAEGLRRLEREFRDAQDVEFTVEDGRLYFLQTRTAKRTPRAALRMAVEMVQEGIIDRATALARLGDNGLSEGLAIARFAEPAEAVASAIAASPGVASGKAAFDSVRAQDLAATGVPVILIRPDTSTEDVAGFAVASGVLTATGGRTAHAAVVARQMGKVCLVGCRALVLAADGHESMIGPFPIREGDWLSLDGDTGDISLGQRHIVTEPPPLCANVLATQ